MSNENKTTDRVRLGPLAKQLDADHPYKVKVTDEGLMLGKHLLKTHNWTAVGEAIRAHEAAKSNWGWGFLRGTPINSSTPITRLDFEDFSVIVGGRFGRPIARFSRFKITPFQYGSESEVKMTCPCPINLMQETSQEILFECSHDTFVRMWVHPAMRASNFGRVEKTGDAIIWTLPNNN